MTWDRIVRFGQLRNRQPTPNGGGCCNSVLYCSVSLRLAAGQFVGSSHAAAARLASPRIRRGGRHHEPLERTARDRWAPERGGGDAGVQCHRLTDRGLEAAIRALAE